MNIKALTALNPSANRTRIAQIINGETPAETPLVVVDEEGAYIYSGVETVIAKQLLDGTQIVGKVVRVKRP